jgi:hypothetical protein
VNWGRDGTQALEKRKVEAATKVCAVWSTSLPSRLRLGTNSGTRTMRNSLYPGTRAGQMDSPPLKNYAWEGWHVGIKEPA